MTSAIDFLHDIDEDLAADVKTFTSTHGQGPGRAAGSLKDVQRNIEAAQTHQAAAQEHEGMAAVNKGSLSSLHSDAADHHDAQTSIHTSIAQQHMKKAKTAQPLGEGFGVRTMDPEALYKPFQPQDKVSYDVPRQKHSQSATVSDLQRVANEVFAKHQCAVTLVRVLENNGFVVSVILPPGNYGGTTFPSVPALEADLIKAVREEIPHAIVDLLDQGAIVGDSPGQFRSRVYFRFRLRDLHRGDLGGP
jgi:hypothetical protein